MILPILMHTLYALITLLRPRTGVFLFFLLLPTYLLRYNIQNIPTTALEIFLLTLFFSLFVHIKKASYKKSWEIIKYQPLFFYGAGLFLFGAILGTLVSVDMHHALGELKAFYIEPAILFFMLLSYSLEGGAKAEKSAPTEKIAVALTLGLFALLLLAIYQKFTGLFVPWDFWENRNTYRITGWYGFPNGAGLMIAALFPYAWYILQNKNHPLTLRAVAIFSLILTPLGIFFAKSTGALLALFTIITGTLLLYKKTQKITAAVITFSIIILFTAPQLSSVRDELTFQDRSGQIRLAIYGETIHLLKDRPVLGAGMASYSERIIPYHKTVHGERIEIFHHPHNIFLTMWMNTTIFGLFGFLIILLTITRIAWKEKHTSKGTLTLMLLTGFFVTGLVDSPYIKNDMAILFWLMPLFVLAIPKNTNDA